MFSDDEEGSWIDEFHEQAHKWKMDRLSEPDCRREVKAGEYTIKELQKEIKFIKRSRNICLDEIKRLRSLLEKRQEDKGVSSPIEQPPEFRRDVVSSGGRNPQQVQYSQARASGREEASVCRDDHEPDQEEYARQPASSERRQSESTRSRRCKGSS